MSVLPAELGRLVVLLLSYGAVCVAFGALFGYVLGPGLVHRCRRFLRSLR